MTIRTLTRVVPVQVDQRLFEYSDSDGAPMGETGFHVMQILTTLATLRLRFRHRDDVYVGANMFIYYRQGDPRAVVAPDVFIVLNTTPEQRRSWKVWEENGRVPAVVFVMTSVSTRDDDLIFKRALYEELGVQEYFLFDPVNEYLAPVLQGFRLVKGRYAPVISQSLADGSYELTSDVLDLTLRAEDTDLVLYDRVTGAKLLTPPELYDWARQAEARAQRAEAELARLRAELARLQGQDRAD